MEIILILISSAISRPSSTHPLSSPWPPDGSRHPPPLVPPSPHHVSGRQRPHTDADGREMTQQCVMVGMSTLFMIRMRKPLGTTTVSFDVHLALAGCFPLPSGDNLRHAGWAKKHKWTI
jgi:hypothetical protein